MNTTLGNRRELSSVLARIRLGSKLYKLTLSASDATRARDAIDQGHTTVVLQELELPRYTDSELLALLQSFLSLSSPKEESLYLSIEDRQYEGREFGPCKVKKLSIDKHQSPNIQVALTLEKIFRLNDNLPPEPPTGGAGMALSMAFNDKAQIPITQLDQPRSSPASKSNSPQQNIAGYNRTPFTSPIFDLLSSPIFDLRPIWEYDPFTSTYRVKGKFSLSIPALQPIWEYDLRTETLRVKGTPYSSAEWAMIRKKENPQSIAELNQAISTQLLGRRGYRLDNQFSLPIQKTPVPYESIGLSSSENTSSRVEPISSETTGSDTGSYGIRQTF